MFNYIWMIIGLAALVLARFFSERMTRRLALARCPVSRSE